MRSRYGTLSLAMLLMVLGGAALRATSAMAATEVVREPPPPPPRPAPKPLSLEGYQLYGAVVTPFTVANGPAAYKRVSGRFDGTPLGQVLYGTVPGGYRIYTRGGIDMNAPIHWWGREVDWTQVLDWIARSRNLAIRVDAYQRVVLIAPNPGPPGGGGARVAREKSANAAAAKPEPPAPHSFVSYGHDVPLVEAVKMLVPSGWSADIEPPAPYDLKVSWSGGRDWVDALRGVAVSNGLNADIDMTARTVRIRAPWKLKAGGSIKQEMEGWARAAGWKVAWKLDHDWSVPADAQFTGTFPEAAQRLIENLHAEGAGIAGRFWSNNVLEIYEQNQ